MEDDRPSTAPTPTGGWDDDAQVGWYLARIGDLPPRQAGERALAELLPPTPGRVLDLGCGDGRLAALVLAERPDVAEVVAVDRSEPMLTAARRRFAADRRVVVRHHDLAEPLAPLGGFDLVVSGFAIHHVDDERKRSLFAEVADQLTPGGTFADLEVVASATPRLHARFLAAIGRTADDAEDRLASCADQVGWLRAAGLVDVDVLWRWRGFALLVGRRPA